MRIRRTSGVIVTFAVFIITLIRPVISFACRNQKKRQKQTERKETSACINEFNIFDSVAVLGITCGTYEQIEKVEEKRSLWRKRELNRHRPALYVRVVWVMWCAAGTFLVPALLAKSRRQLTTRIRH